MGYLSVCTCQNSLIYTLKFSAFHLYVKYTSISKIWLEIGPRKPLCVYFELKKEKKKEKQK